MTERVVADLVIDARSTLGECPVWDDRYGDLLWVDMPSGDLHRWQLSAQKHDVFHVSDFISAIALDREGAYIAALRDQVVHLNSSAALTDVIVAVDVGSACRLNDGKCDSFGRFWVGSTAYDEKTSAANLYCVYRDGQAVSVLEGVTISNGLDWSRDTRQMYYIDSPLKRIDVFDFDIDTGTITNRRPLIDTHDTPGEPDGMTVDADGALWVAFWGGARVKQYSPRGEELQEILVPPANVTSCAFGGSSLTDLYITTAADDDVQGDLNSDTHAGGVFVAQLGIQGRPSNRFNR